jgi:ribosomal protein S18 acetylase RimI-like enzyme
MPTYRPALVADLQALCTLGEEVNAIHHRAFPHIFAGPGAPERDLAHWRSSVETEGAQTFVAEEGGQIVGFVTVSMATESHCFAQPLRFGRVGSVAVAESKRGQGIGPELMNLAHAWVKGNGGHEVRLNVWAFNEHALHVYQELGYEVRSHNLAKIVASGA